MELTGESKPLNYRKSLWNKLKDISRRYKSVSPLCDIDDSTKKQKGKKMFYKEGSFVNENGEGILKIEISSRCHNENEGNLMGEEMVASTESPLVEKELGCDESVVESRECNSPLYYNSEINEDDDYMNLKYDIQNNDNVFQLKWNVVNVDRKMNRFSKDLVSNSSESLRDRPRENLVSNLTESLRNRPRENLVSNLIESLRDRPREDLVSNLTESLSCAVFHEDSKGILNENYRDDEGITNENNLKYLDSEKDSDADDRLSKDSLYEYEISDQSDSSEVADSLQCSKYCQNELSASSSSFVVQTNDSIHVIKETESNAENCTNFVENQSKSSQTDDMDFKVKSLETVSISHSVSTESLKCSQDKSETEIYSKQLESANCVKDIDRKLRPFSDPSSQTFKKKISSGKDLSRFKYWNSLSKGMTINNLEKTIKIRLEEANNSMSYYSKEQKGPEMVLKVIQESLLELSSKSVSFKEILFVLSESVEKVQKQVAFAVRKLNFLQDLETMATNRKTLEREESFLALHWKEKEDKLLKELQQQIQINNCLKTQIDDLEKLLRDERNNFNKEQDLRQHAETMLMITKIEARATERKLKSVKKGDPDFDPQLLQIAFKKCREELSNRTKLLQEIEFHHKEVVPREELEKVSKKYEGLCHLHKKVSHAHDLLKNKYDKLIESYDSLCEERDKICCENLSLRHCATPRPQWNRVAEHIEGGIQRWHEISQGLSSDQLLEVLLNELSGPSTGLSLTTAEYLTGQGDSENVPAFLRYNGSVRNKKLTKRDTLILINDIWDERRKSKLKCCFTDFLNQYFSERYHIEEIRAEWCYSLVDACQRLAHEEEIGLFWGIICGQIQEDIYHHQEKMMEDILNAFKENDRKNKGYIMKEKVLLILRELFPLKSQESLDEILNLIQKTSSLRDPEVIKYKLLFYQDTLRSSSQRLPLSLLLNKQMREEQQKYISDILKEIKPTAGDVSVEELGRAFTMVDPYIEHSQLDAYLSWVFCTERDSLKDAPWIPLALLGARLQTGLIYRIGKKPEENAI
ncbi:UNVERIFIED_CONTAM: hypothetical protein RMT77_013193 [Armadillidium vulgare]